MQCSQQIRIVAASIPSRDQLLTVSAATHPTLLLVTYVQSNDNRQGKFPSRQSGMCKKKGKDLFI